MGVQTVLSGNIGQQEPSVETLHRSSWAERHQFVPDGIAAVAPGANALSSFLDMVGIQ